MVVMVNWIAQPIVHWLYTLASYSNVGVSHYVGSTKELFERNSVAAEEIRKLQKCFGTLNKVARPALVDDRKFQPPNNVSSFYQYTFELIKSIFTLISFFFLISGIVCSLPHADVICNLVFLSSCDSSYSVLTQ